MSHEIKIAVAGAGLIGKRHVNSIMSGNGTSVCAIVDPSDSAKEFAKSLGIVCYDSLEEMFKNIKPDGVIIATPNKLHIENGFVCLDNNCPMLIEKPIATSSKEAQVLVDAAAEKNIPILIGHHRRHNPLMKKAKELIVDGKLGEIRAVQATCWLYKPDDYFEEAPWRKLEGAGPVSVNLAHDIDLVRYLCGDVESVQTQTTKSIRGYENEDVAAIVLKFKSGTVGTVTVSDMIVAPWSWELTAGENPAYPSTQESCYLVGGTDGSLSLPDLRLWRFDGEKSWWNPMSSTNTPREDSDPLINQINHFARVIKEEELPLVSGLEGLKTLAVIEAVERSSRSQEIVYLD